MKNTLFQCFKVPFFVWLALAVAGFAAYGYANYTAQGRNPPQLPSDASALSGGKIKIFIPMPGLPNNPTDKAMLKACQQIKLNSRTARSGFILLNTSNGKYPVPVLIVGTQTLVSVGESSEA